MTLLFEACHLTQSLPALAHELGDPERVNSTIPNPQNPDFQVVYLCPDSGTTLPISNGHL